MSFANITYLSINVIVLHSMCILIYQISLTILATGGLDAVFGACVGSYATVAVLDFRESTGGPCLVRQYLRCE